MKRKILRLIFAIASPFTYLAALWLRYIRHKGIEVSAVNDKIFMSVGVLPVTEHYYEPMINPHKQLKKPLDEVRNLPGIDLNIEHQLELLSAFHYNDEIVGFPLQKQKEGEFYFDNQWYSTGDAEFLYNIIRHYKPARIIEIGSGLSTLMAIEAVRKNNSDDPKYSCSHICVEPYECKWLEKLSEIEVIRKRVEDVDSKFFMQLEKNDILFIDSSHVIRPQGDVLFEFLEVLPVLNSGVLVHIHDIFTPRDYPEEWVFKNHTFWNEQYLMEAFLSNNKDYQIIGALNYLAHNFKNEFSDKCPVFAANLGYAGLKNEPRAFWIQRK